MDLSQTVSKSSSIIKGIPSWRRWFYAGLALFVLVYLAWSRWGKHPQPPSAGFVTAKPAVDAAKVPGPIVKTQIKVVPIEKVTETYREFVGPPNVVVVDTAKVPPAPNGAVTVTTLDPATGEATTQVKIKEAPWFAFERNNALGAGYEIGSQGSKIPVYYRRDILRVKDVHLVGEVGAKLALDPVQRSEVHATGLVEWRF